VRRFQSIFPVFEVVIQLTQKDTDKTNKGAKTNDFDRREQTPVC